MRSKQPEPSRRKFLKLASAGIGTSIFLPMLKVDQLILANPNNDMKLGMASYTFRNFTLDETINMTKQLDIDWIALKSFHLPLESAKDEIKKIAAKVRQNGLNLYGAGVIYMKNTEEVKRAFEYASSAEFKIILGVPDHHLLPLVEDKVKAYDIKVAIHNHGPGDEKYPSPKIIFDKIEALDNRIGMCIDIGHVARYGLDPVQEIKRYGKRILDVHIKDVDNASEDGKTVEMGRGIIDIPEVLNTLIKMDYQGVLAFEFEKDKNNPLPGLAESVGYVRGILRCIN